MASWELRPGTRRRSAPIRGSGFGRSKGPLGGVAAPKRPVAQQPRSRRLPLMRQGSHDTGRRGPHPCGRAHAGPMRQAHAPQRPQRRRPIVLQSSYLTPQLSCPLTSCIPAYTTATRTVHFTRRIRVPAPRRALPLPPAHHFLR